MGEWLRHSDFFRLYFMIRSKYKLPHLFKWILHIQHIFVICPLMLLFPKPTDIFNAIDKSSILGYYESVVFFLPWIFGTQTFLIDSITFFIINILFFLIVFSTVYIAKKYNQINFWTTYTITIYQCLFTNFSLGALSFRFAYILERLIYFDGKYNTELIISFSLAVINLILNSLHLYMASIFLFPFDFVQESKIDLYDGKYQIALMWSRFLLYITCFFLKYMVKNIVLGIIVGLVIFGCFVIIYLRVTCRTYVSFLGQFIECSPFFVFPFMFLVYKFSNNWVYSIVVFFASIIILFIFIFTYNQLLVNHTLKSFSPFVKKLDRKSKQIYFPSFLMSSRTTVIRVISSYQCDPKSINYFLKVHKKISKKNSSKIEVIRFLALFPSRREMCIQELKALFPKSIHTRFTLYRFVKLLKGYTRQPTHNQKKKLNDLYRSYLVHNHLYWKARKNKMWKKSFIEAFTTAYYYTETKVEIVSMIKLFPYDHALHLLYSDFMLSACGDFEGYKRELTFAKNIEANKKSITDPLLHPMSLYNPKILQFCSEEEVERTHSNEDSKSKSSRHSIFGSSERSISSARHNKKINKSNPVVTFLNRSKRLVPLFAPLHLFFPIVAVLAITGILYPQSLRINNSFNDIISNTKLLTADYYRASSTFFIPYFLSIRETIDNCYDDFLNLPFQLAELYSSTQIVRNLTTGMIIMLKYHMSSKILNPLYNTTYDLCNITENINNDIDPFIINLTNSFSLTTFKMRDLMTYIIEVSEKQFSFTTIVSIVAVVLILFNIISFFITFFQVNLIMNDERKIDFLAQKERLSLFLLQESRKSWELLRNTFSESSSINENSSASSNTLSSLHEFPREFSNNFFPKEGNLLKNSAFNVLNVENHSIKPHYSSGGENIDLTNIKKDNSSGNVSEETDQSTQEHNDEHQTTVNSDSNITNSSTNFHSNEVDIVDQEIETVYKDSHSHSYISILILMIFFSIFLIIIISISILSVKGHSNSGYQTTLRLFHSLEQTYMSFLLLNYSYSITMGRFPTITQIEEIESSLNKTDLPLYSLYSEEQCLDAGSAVCISISTIISYLKKSQISSVEMGSLFLPFVYQFTRQVLYSYFYQLSIDSFENSVSNGISFIILISIASLLLIYTSYCVSFFLYEAMNSLYHFPNDFIAVSNDDKIPKNINKDAFPQNVIIITSVTETDEIYSVSDNSKAIIGKSLNDLVSQKFSTTFPLVHNEANLREFITSDKKRKVFRFSSENIGIMTKTVLVEESVPIQNPRDKPFSKILVEYMTPYFAKQYGDNDVTSFDFNHIYIISIRINPTSSVQIVDKFFNSCNHTTQNYNTINLLHIDGEMIIFSTVSDITSIIILLFIRDLLKEATTMSKNSEVNFPICSILVDFFNQINCSINNNDEPYLEFKPEPDFFKFRLYHTNEKTVSFSEDTVKRLFWIKKCTKAVKIALNFKGKTETLYETSIKQFESEIVLPHI